MTDQAAPQTLLDRIARASDGLLIMSETDSPLTPFLWADFFSEEGAEENIVEALLRHEKHDEQTDVETITLEEFLRTQIDPDAADDAEMMDEERQLLELRDLLAKELQDVSVYRVGEISIPVYVLGRVPGTRDAAGVSTEIVET